MSDIEDLGSLVSSVDVGNNSRAKHDGSVLATTLLGSEDPSDIDKSPYLDNSGRVFVKTWGCSHNSSDSEYMKGLLYRAGYDLVESLDQADVCVLNSCTVKDPSESVFINHIRQAEDAGVKLVLAGCVPQADSNNTLFQRHSVIGVKQVDRIVEVVSNTLQGNTVRLLGNSARSAGSRLELPKIRRNPFIEILPINTGCLNHCTYCKTKQSRGQLASYSVKEIVQRIHSVAAEGVREIWLTSEDLGAYGHDIGTSLSEMLSAVLSDLPPGLYLRLGMTNPPHILAQIAQIAHMLNHPRVFSFLHIPVQSGSTRVLQQMGRDYTRRDFEVLVDYLLGHVPDLHLATDIICGFPTETDLEFQETLSLVDQYRFAAVHISQFYARRGTAAARMSRIGSQLIKDRSRAMTNLFQSYRSYDDKIGRQYNVLCTEMAADGVHLVAHNKSYDQILVAGQPDQLLGNCFRVCIRSCDKFHMIGDIIPGTVTYDLPLHNTNTTTTSSSSSTGNPAHQHLRSAPSPLAPASRTCSGGGSSSSSSSSRTWSGHTHHRLGFAVLLVLIAVVIRALRHISLFN